MKIFTKQLSVASYDVDTCRVLKPSAILKMVQQTGEEHLQEINYSFSKLYSLGVVFIITKCSVSILKNANFMDKLTIKTWCANSNGLHYKRFYEFYSEQNELLIKCVTSSTPIDPQTRKILRKFNLLDDLLFDNLPSVLEIDAISNRNMPLLNSFKRTIRYSDLDYNNHLNNTVYSDFLVDYFPKNIYEYTITDFTIYFKSECMLYELLDIDVYEVGEGILGYEGKVDNKIKFIAQMQFTNK